MDIDAYILKKFRKSLDSEFDNWVYETTQKLIEQDYTTGSAIRRIGQVVFNNFDTIWEQWLKRHPTENGDEFQEIILPVISRVLFMDFDTMDTVNPKLTIKFLKSVSWYDQIYIWKALFESYPSIRNYLERLYSFDRNILSMAANIIDPDDDDENTKLAEKIRKKAINIAINLRDYEQMGQILKIHHLSDTKAETWEKISSWFNECTVEELKLVLKELTLEDVASIFGLEFVSACLDCFILACAELFGGKEIANMVFITSYGIKYFKRRTLLAYAIEDRDVGLVKLLIRLGADPRYVGDVPVETPIPVWKRPQPEMPSLRQNALELIAEEEAKRETNPDDPMVIIRRKRLAKIKRYLESVMTRHLMIYGRNRIQDELHGGSEWRAFKREGGSGGAASGH
jgi:hypothetical protein